MNYGFTDDGLFYVDYRSCLYRPGNMRQETEKRAIDIGSKYSNIWVSNSGGIDSQAMILSFLKAGVPFESAFMWNPGHNDNELEQVKLVDEKNKIKTHIIELNPEDYKEEILAKAEEFDIHPNSILQNIFVSKLPENANIVSMVHDPFVFILEDSGPKVFWYMGYYSPEIYRDRAAKTLNRSGQIISYGDTSEFLYSILNDDVYRACINAWDYFKDNGLTKPGVKLNGPDRWDYYIKPLIYGKYWSNTELMFFTKNQGFKSIDWINVVRQHKEGPGVLSTIAIGIPFSPFLKFLESCSGETKRYYQNIKNQRFVAPEFRRNPELISNV